MPRSIVDNFDNSDPESLHRVREITGCAEDDLVFVEMDLCDAPAVEKLVRRSLARRARAPAILLRARPRVCLRTWRDPTPFLTPHVRSHSSRATPSHP